MQALAGFKPSGLAEAIELMQGCKDESAVAALETALQQRDVQRLESALRSAKESLEKQRREKKSGAQLLGLDLRRGDR